MNSVTSFFTGSGSQTDARRTKTSSTSSTGNGKKEEEEDVPRVNNTVRKVKSTGSYGSKVKCPNTLAVREVGDIVEDIWDFIGPDETDMIMFQTGLITGAAVATIASPLVAAAVAIVISKGDDISKLLIKAISKGAGKNVFKTQELLDSHYVKHAKEFGSITKDQYLKGAQNLVNSRPGGNILTKTRSNGDILFYNKANNEFAVKAPDGTIRTYFKPTDGIDYFYRQK